MNLREQQVLQFIQHPFPLWETALTSLLVEDKWHDLKTKGFSAPDSYNTAGIWLDNPSLKMAEKKCIPQSNLQLEMTSAHLDTFYEENGLELLSEDEIEKSGTLLKLSKAISVLHLIEPAYECITDLVCTIQVLRQPEPEVDLSYSHPQIPFSIFLSVCEDDSTISNLRVAESILHEAMHLKLTLIENTVPLLKPNDHSVYYSPWREDERPVGGVLHGLFVFKAILEFYKELYKTKKLLEADHYINTRNSQVKKEIAQLKDFEASSGLTSAGASLARSLLSLN